MPYIVLIYFMMFSLCINQTLPLPAKTRQTASNTPPFGDVNIEVALQKLPALADHHEWQGRLRPQAVEGANRHAKEVCGLSARQDFRRGAIRGHLHYGVIHTSRSGLVACSWWSPTGTSGPALCSSTQADRRHASAAAWRARRRTNDSRHGAAVGLAKCCLWDSGSDIPASVLTERQVVVQA